MGKEESSLHSGIKCIEADSAVVISQESFSGTCGSITLCFSVQICFVLCVFMLQIHAELYQPWADFLFSTGFPKGWMTLGIQLALPGR